MKTIVLAWVENIAILLGQASMLARSRQASHPSPVVHMAGLRDQEYAENQLLRRENAVLRERLALVPPHQRPDCSPSHRLEIVQITRLRDWSPAEAAQHFVLHANTIRGWLRAIHQGKTEKLFTGVPGWNRLHDRVRHAAQQLRSLFPEPEFGSRTIACHLNRGSVQISRSSVQRILREPSPPASTPKLALVPPGGKEAHGLLKPQTPNRVWHADLTTWRMLWLQFTVAAVADGYSRKLLALHVYEKVPGTSHLLALIRGAAAQFGRPRFLITDHGGQFKKKFTAGLKRDGTQHVTGRVRCPAMNGKIERFFRTLRGWGRGTLLALSAASIQRRLDRFRHWYNHHRPHSALGGRTPDEAWNGIELSKPAPIYARDAVDVEIEVSRRSYAGDRRLPIVDIAVSVRQRQAA